ncbi:hypothetical conserved protein [Candidatus Nitrosoglobus terrae]|uniref:Hypothetical conserved protein n=2 Tax=Candidatus Nitrosoglobus terrae TaxID=1630141 RepID=A0A1Q2SK89_9GAMM|nr:hypothetical conserved protein [Candidatus Nitrosoglobus terrae]
MLANLLAGLCLLALIIIVLKALYPVRLSPDAGKTQAKTDSVNTHPPARKPPEQIALIPFTRYGEIATRPLFRPNRQPPDPDEMETGETNETKEQRAIREREEQQLNSHVEDLFVISGIVVTDHKAIALLHDIKNDKLLRAIEGEELEGWKIKQIFPDNVLFRNTERVETLNLIRRFEPVKASTSPKNSPSAR